MAHLLLTPPRPDARALALAFAPPTQTPSAREAPIWAHRERLTPGRASVPDEPGLRIAWALTEAALLGAELAQRQAATTAHAGRRGPEDAEARRLWALMLSPDPWPARLRWEALYLGPVRRAFALHLEERGLPLERRRHIIADLRDAFFLAFLPERQGGSSPGAALRELVVRVLEAGPEGSVTDLARQLDARTRLRLATCATERDQARVTARLLWPEARRRSAVQSAFFSAIEASGDALAPMADLHVLVRLLERWQTPEYTSQAAIRRVVTQNRGRARGRMRALASSLPTAALRDAVLAAPGLHARTVTAMSRLGRDWARQERLHDYTLSSMRGLTPACRGEEPELSELDPDALRTWCALVILRGRLPLLERWIHEGGAGSTGATFGRLLTTYMPPCLLVGEDRIDQLDALRLTLRRELPAILVRLTPLVARVASLDPRGRGVLGRLHAVLAPDWSEALPLPASVPATLIRHAREARDMMDVSARVA